MASKVNFSNVLLYSVQIRLVRYVDTVLPDLVFQNIVKFFVRNSHDFVEWTWAIQSEYETLINYSASKTKNSRDYRMCADSCQCTQKRKKMAKFCPRSCWMTPKLFFAQIEFWFLMHYDLSVFHTQTGLPKDCPGPFHKIMTVSNEKFDYILRK